MFTSGTWNGEREAVEMVLDANRELAERSIAGKVVSREPFDLSPS